jgi:hypothetical protein
MLQSPQGAGNLPTEIKLMGVPASWVAVVQYSYMQRRNSPGARRDLAMIYQSTTISVQIVREPAVNIEYRGQVLKYQFMPLLITLLIVV